MTPREVVDVDGCSLTIETPDPNEDADAIANGAVIQISATIWLGTRKQLDELIAGLVAYGNELDKQAVRAA
jgi:hypothetical protein